MDGTVRCGMGATYGLHAKLAELPVERWVRVGRGLATKSGFPVPRIRPSLHMHANKHQKRVCACGVHWIPILQPRYLPSLPQEKKVKVYQRPRKSEKKEISDDPTFSASTTLVRRNCIWYRYARYSLLGTTIQHFPRQRFRTYAQTEGSTLDITTLATYYIRCSLYWLLTPIALSFFPPLITLMTIVSRIRLLHTLTFDIDVQCAMRNKDRRAHLGRTITGYGCCGITTRALLLVRSMHTCLFLPAYMRTCLYFVSSCSFQ